MPIRVPADDGPVQAKKVRGRRESVAVERCVKVRIDFDPSHQEAFRSVPEVVATRSSKSLTAASTSTGLRSFMQRWSSGQTRFWQGPQGTFFCSRISFAK